jgi:hypothetical protein
VGEADNKKVQLALPPVRRFDEIFDSGFGGFLRRIRDQPDAPQEHRRQTPEMDVVVSYRPGNRLSSGGYPTYGAPVSLMRNPLYHALVRKARQIRDAGVTGPTVIFACDGGAYSVQHRFGGSPSTYDRRAIVRHFFTKRSISAVCLITVERTSSPTSLVAFSGPPALRVECLIHPSAADIGGWVPGLMQQLAAVLPPPVDEAVNAIHWLESGHTHDGRPFYGGCEVSESVKVPTRAVQELLAGRLESSKFLQDHHFLGPDSIPNPFERALAAGQTISSVTVERSEHRDDDWVTFHFSPPDPAISAFVEDQNRRAGDS